MIDGQNLSEKQLKIAMIALPVGSRMVLSKNDLKMLKCPPQVAMFFVQQLSKSASTDVKETEMVQAMILLCANMENIQCFTDQEAFATLSVIFMSQPNAREIVLDAIWSLTTQATFPKLLKCSKMMTKLSGFEKMTPSEVLNAGNRVLVKLEQLKNPRGMEFIIICTAIHLIAF